MFVCLSVRKKSFTGKLKLTYSELFFTTEKHAGSFKILTAAQRAGISTSVDNSNTYCLCLGAHTIAIASGIMSW